MKYKNKLGEICDTDQPEFPIIETPEYILAVSDEEIKVGDYGLSKVNEIIIFGKNYNSKLYKKIIAHQPKNKSPEIEGLPLLPEIVVEDDVEKLIELEIEKAKKKYNWHFSIGQLLRHFYRGGYKAATKVYSEEDLRKAFNAGDTYRYYENGGFRSIPSDVLDEDEYIQSLKQPKTPKSFVAEIEKYDFDEEWCENIGAYETHRERLKTIIINGKKHLVGTYKFD